MSDTYNIAIRTNRIHIHQYGNGKHLLLLFHGFGESGASYGALGNLGNSFTIIVPDLPFHGKTKWGKEPLTTDDLLELVQRILKKKGTKSFSLLGYSMGGRLAICLLQRAPRLVDHFLLVAPEGLRKNPWFHLATGTLPGQWLFRKIIFHPQVFISMLKLFRKTGWINKTAAHYLQELMTDASTRSRVYHCWQCFRKLHPRTGRYAFKNISSPLHFYFGKYDRLIPPPSEKEIQKWLPAEVSVFSTGHLLFLHEPLLNEISAYLCTPATT